MHLYCFSRYAVWATMVPTSFISGLAAAPLWTAQGAYFNILAERYAHISKETKQSVVTRFSGIFFSFFQICKNILHSVKILSYTGTILILITYHSLSFHYFIVQSSLCISIFRHFTCIIFCSFLIMLFSNDLLL